MLILHICPGCVLSKKSKNRQIFRRFVDPQRWIVDIRCTTQRTQKSYIHWIHNFLTITYHTRTVLTREILSSQSDNNGKIERQTITRCSGGSPVYSRCTVQILAIHAYSQLHDRTHCILVTHALTYSRAKFAPSDRQRQKVQSNSDMNPH